MRRRVILYNPPSVFYTMPLGLLAVAGGLSPEHHQVEIIDARLHDDPIAVLLNRLPGAVALGMGVLTGAPIQGAVEATRAARARFPRLPIVWGGWHPSLFPKSCLEEVPIDAVVVGAGQEAFAEWLRAVEERGDPGAVAGVWSRLENGTLVQGPPPRLPSLERLPPLDYRLLDVPLWLKRKGKRQLDYIASVGCNFRCAFCADPQVYQRQWTGLSPVRMVEELEALIRQYGIEEVAFQDETFFTQRARVQEMAREILGRGLKFRWSATLRADQGARLPMETLEACRDAGFSRAIVGVESAHVEMLKALKKDVSIEQVWKTAERMEKLSVAVTWNFIVGFAGETEEMVEASLAAARKLRAMSPLFETPIFFYKPYPGSPTAQAVEDAGFPLPRTLEEWSRFDFVESGAGAWMPESRQRRVERFRFYQRHAYGPRPPPWRWPLRALSRLRMQQDNYSIPLEKWVMERLRPGSRMA